MTHASIAMMCMQLLFEGNPFRRIPRAKMTGGIAQLKTYLLSRLSDDELKAYEASQLASKSAKGSGQIGFKFKASSTAAAANDDFVNVKLNDVKPYSFSANPNTAAAAQPQQS